MIPLAFELHARRASLDEALAAIRDGAKPIAGGQSLVPLMRLRLAGARARSSTSAGLGELPASARRAARS